MSPTTSTMVRSLSPVPTWLTWAGLFCFWIAMRVLDGGEGSGEFEIFLTLAGGSFVVAVILRLTQLGSAGAAKAFVQAWLGAAAVLAIGAGLVFLYRDMAGSDDGDSGPGVLVLGLLMLVSAALVMTALQLAANPMRQAGHLEGRRLGFASMTAGIAVCGVAALAAFNYVAVERELRVDLSFGAPTKPSAATLSLIEAATDPVEVFLFFERGSPVIAEVGDYFEALKAAGATVTRLDHALDPELSEKMKVSKNGTVGFRSGEQTEKWFLGTERDQARRKLKKVDEEVATRLAKVTREEQKIYFTVGHGEREERKAARGARPGANELFDIAETLNVKKTKLGLAEGLGSAVPDDADVVLVLGPTEPFLEAEINALVAYVERGGALMVALEPDKDVGLEPLLGALGLSSDPGVVCNDKEFVVQTRTPADHAFIISTSFTSHKTTRTLSSARGRAAVLFLGSGALVEAADKKAQRKVTMLAKSRDGSFVDKNQNRTFDEKTEKRAIYNLAAAVEIERTGEGALPGRAIVFSDSEMLADGLMPNDANRVFVSDTLRWLMRDDAAAGAIDTDDDVPIVHTRDGDAAWFYGTTFVAPLAVLLVGLLMVRMRRRRRLS
jgi:hypothetical protein